VFVLLISKAALAFLAGSFPFYNRRKNPGQHPNIEHWQNTGMQSGLGYLLNFRKHFQVEMQ